MAGWVGRQGGLKVRGGRSGENWSMRHPNRSIQGAFGAPELLDEAGLPGLDRLAGRAGRAGRAGWAGRAGQASRAA